MSIVSEAALTEDAREGEGRRLGEGGVLVYLVHVGEAEDELAVVPSGVIVGDCHQLDIGRKISLDGAHHGCGRFDHPVREAERRWEIQLFDELTTGRVGVLDAVQHQVDGASHGQTRAVATAIALVPMRTLAPNAGLAMI